MAQSKVHRRGPIKPQLNMTPLIDVTFLLIIFFMVISNFIAEETVQMIVPDLDKPKVRQFEQMNRVMVNIAPKRYGKDDRGANYLGWEGQAQYVKIGTSPRAYAMDEMDQVTTMLAAMVESDPKDAEGKSTLEVLLRADAALYYDSVQPVMMAITGAGVSKVHMVSYLPDQGPRR